jgi:hypothetical protein
MKRSCTLKCTFKYFIDLEIKKDFVYIITKHRVFYLIRMVNLIL